MEHDIAQGTIFRYHDVDNGEGTIPRWGVRDWVTNLPLPAATPPIILESDTLMASTASACYSKRSKPNS